MRIYLDNCCLNRPYDDLSDDKVRLESEAVLSIIDRCETDDWSFYSSDILLDEILEITDLVRREKVMLLYQSASTHIVLTEGIVKRAKELEQFNIGSFAALHVSCAESVGADIFLTTDKKFINRAGRSNLKIEVKNPLMWLMEVLYERKS
jgi:hypothetical protein